MLRREKSSNRLATDARAQEFLRRSNRGTKEDKSEGRSSIVDKIVTTLFERGSRRRSNNIDSTHTSDEGRSASSPQPCSHNVQEDEDQLRSPVSSEKRTKPSCGSPRESTVIIDDSDDSLQYTGRSSDCDW